MRKDKKILRSKQRKRTKPATKEKIMRAIILKLITTASHFKKTASINEIAEQKTTNFVSEVFALAEFLVHRWHSVHWVDWPNGASSLPLGHQRLALQGQALALGLNYPLESEENLQESNIK